MSPFQISPVSKVSNFIDFYAETKSCLSISERRLITDIEDELMEMDSITDEAQEMWSHIINRLCNVAQNQGIPIPIEFPQVKNGMTTESSLDWYCTRMF